MNSQDCAPGHDDAAEEDGGDGDDDNGDGDAEEDGDDDGENLMPCTDTDSVISCTLKTHRGKVR